MSSHRLKMSLEELLCRTALEHFGREHLEQTVVDPRKKAGPLKRATVEHPTREQVGQDVLEILVAAQTQADAAVHGRKEMPDRIALYSQHASHLSDGTLKAVPVAALPRALRRAWLEDDLGILDVGLPRSIIHTRH